MKLGVFSHLPGWVQTFERFSLFRTKITGVKPPADRGPDWKEMVSDGSDFWTNYKKAIVRTRKREKKHKTQCTHGEKEKEETKCLTDIWSDEFIKSPLEKKITEIPTLQ